MSVFNPKDLNNTIPNTFWRESYGNYYLNHTNTKGYNHCVAQVVKTRSGKSFMVNVYRNLPSNPYIFSESLKEIGEEKVLKNAILRTHDIILNSCTVCLERQGKVNKVVKGRCKFCKSHQKLVKQICK